MLRGGFKKTRGVGYSALMGHVLSISSSWMAFGKRGLKKEGSEEGWGGSRCEEAGAFYVEEKF